MPLPGPSTGMTPEKIPSIAYDEAAFEDFYREHVAAVQRFIVRRVA